MSPGTAVASALPCAALCVVIVTQLAMVSSLRIGAVVKLRPLLGCSK